MKEKHRSEKGRAEVEAPPESPPASIWLNLRPAAEMAAPEAKKRPKASGPNEAMAKSTASSSTEGTRANPKTLGSARPVSPKSGPKAPPFGIPVPPRLAQALKLPQNPPPAAGVDQPRFQRLQGPPMSGEPMSSGSQGSGSTKISSMKIKTRQVWSLSREKGTRRQLKLKTAPSNWRPTTRKLIEGGRSLSQPLRSGDSQPMSSSPMSEGPEPKLVLLNCWRSRGWQRGRLKELFPPKRGRARGR